MINLVQYNIGPGTMIAIPSESFIQVQKTSDDVQMHAVLFSLAFIHETHLDRSIINTFYIINEHPCSHCPREFSASTSRLSRF